MQGIKGKLMQWYQLNKRGLPWRETRDPYKIWISEVILQQTRVSQGLEYYLQFISTFPNLRALALAPVDEVLLVWKGLGYYSRARNLHLAARTIIDGYGGIFPSTYEQLLNLKGVGQYTAAAVASIAFGECVPVVDGNVVRLYARLFNINEAFGSASGRKAFYKVAYDQMDCQNPGDYNQAVMEFGALCCTPLSPACNQCVLKNYCYAYKYNKVDMLPKKQKKPLVKTRYFNYLVLLHKGSVHLVKRQAGDIWDSLYDLPLVETTRKTAFSQLCKSKAFIGITGQAAYTFEGSSKMITHKLTHQHIMARFYVLNVDKPIDGYLCAPLHYMHKFALPRLTDKYLADLLKRLDEKSNYTG